MAGKPTKIKIEGEVFVAAPFVITEEDPDGYPRMCRMMHPDETVDLTQGAPTKFLVGYVPEHMVRPKPVAQG